VKSVQKTFKQDSVEVNILNYDIEPGRDRTNINIISKIEILREKQVIFRCVDVIRSFSYLYAEDPGILVVGWKTYAQLELEHNLYSSSIGIIHGIMYIDGVMIIADPKRDFSIKALPRPQSAIDNRPEGEKIIEEFKELAVRAIDLGVGVNQLRKVISSALIHKVLDS